MSLLSDGQRLAWAEFQPSALQVERQPSAVWPWVVLAFAVGVLF